MRLVGFQKLLEHSLTTATGLILGLLLMRSVTSPLGLDEGYNLEVVQNLSQGLGYASFGNHRMDAWWSARPDLLEALSKGQLGNLSPKPWFFDPRVTTGPTVLMPLGLLFWVLPGNLFAIRIFMWSFVVLFYLSLCLALPQGARRPSTLALAGSLAVSLWYSFRPGAVLGELPTAALFAAACVAAARARPFLGGVLFGFASLAKTIALPGSLLVIGVVGLSHLLGKQEQKHAFFSLAAGLLMPLAAFELYRFFVLGSFDSWLASWREFLAFSKEQTTLPPGVLLGKWRSFQALGPGVSFALAAVAAVLGLVFTSRRIATLSQPRPRLYQNPGALMLIGALPMALIWVFRSAQTSYRQAIPAALLLFAGLMLWWFSNAGREMFYSPGATRQLACYLGALVLSLIAVVTWAVRFWRAGELAERFEEQKWAAALLKTSGAQSISSAVRFYEPFPFLTNLRVNPCPGPGQVLIVTAWAQVATGKDRGFYRSRCEEVIFENKDALICWPKSILFSLKDLEVSDWGPRQLTYSQNPRERKHKTPAFWFRLKHPVLQRPYLVLLVADQPSGLVTWAADGTWFSAPLDATLTSGLKEAELTVWDPCAGERKGVGRVQIISR